MSSFRRAIRQFFLVACCLVPLAVLSASLTAQVPDAADIFLDCQAPGCDSEHIRNEIDWVSWVRDRTVADVHLLITAESAGGGGTAYQLSFMGLRAFDGDSLTLRVVSDPNLSGADRRDLLTTRISQGLLYYAARTGAADRLTVTARAGREAAPITPQDDPWNSWVFGVRLEASMEGESRESSREFELSFDATRVTRDLRLELDLEASYEEDRFELRSGEQRFITRNWELELLAARALAERWSAGASFETGRSTFQNQDFYARPAALLEYSFYPYGEFSRRRLTAQYSLGSIYADYAERTIYDRMNEHRLDQRLEVAAEYQQPWGSAWSVLTGSHYLHDMNRNRLAGEVGLLVRLFRGFTLDISAEYARVHDQLYIPAGDADDEEILLRRRALETAYEYETSIGIRYAFGSVYNTVVNPRLRR